MNEGVKAFIYGSTHFSFSFFLVVKYVDIPVSSHLGQLTVVILQDSRFVHRFQLREPRDVRHQTRRRLKNANGDEENRPRRPRSSASSSPTTDRFAGIRSKSVNLSSSSWEWNRILISNKLIVTVELACKPFVFE